MGPYIHIKDCCIQTVFAVIFSKHCLFDRIGTADTGAVSLGTDMDIP